MSRLGKRAVILNDKTEATIDSGELTIKGPRGSLSRMIRTEIGVIIDGKNISLALLKNTKLGSALWGTYASHIMNMIHGVNEGFEKKLILDGVGYKGEVKGDTLVLALGFSHPVIVPIPVGIVAKVEKNTFTFSGIDKELVGSFSAKVRSLKKPEPYKGKGFRYSDEIIRRKQGKKSA